MIAETSLEAYFQLKDTDKLTERQKQVLAVFMPGQDYSLNEISMRCGLPVNCVSGRVGELRKAGKLEAAERRLCKVTGNGCYPSKLKGA